MWDFLAIIGLIAIPVFIILAIISLVKKKGKAKRNFLLAGAGFVLFMVGVLNAPTSDTTSPNIENETPADDASDENDAEQSEEEKASEEEAKKKAEEEAARAKAEEEAKKTPQQKMIDSIVGLVDSKLAFDTGSYIKGDIPEGEYAFVTFQGSGQYYAEKDSAGNIIDNENFDSFGYVYVHGVGNISNDGVLINTNSFETLGVSSAKEIYEIVNNVENYKESAWYKIGTDLPAGSYVIESYGEGYVAVMSGPIGKNDIIDNEIFNGRHQVTVSNGQYLVVSGGYISE